MTKRRSRRGQSYTATPKLRSLEMPPARPVTVTGADGQTRTEPAARAVPTPTPRRRRHAPQLERRRDVPATPKIDRPAVRVEEGKKVYSLDQALAFRNRRPLRVDNGL